MASPPISHLGSWDFVGSTLDSSYHGSTILDSASTNINSGGQLLSFEKILDIDSRVFQPITLNDYLPNPNTISFQSSNGAIGNFGGAADVVVASSEKWY